jgi:hypothetical protein
MANLLGTTTTNENMQTQEINNHWRFDDAETEQFMYHKTIPNSSLNIFTDYSSLNPTTTTATGYYMIIDSEVIEITNVAPHPNAPDLYQIFTTNRGVLGSTSVGHGVDEQVQIWDGVPDGYSSYEEPSETESQESPQEGTTIKALILDQPKLGDVSHYNFKESETDFSYVNSIGLPENIDKFDNKDLHTTSMGSEINEVILQSNMKFSGSSYIRIDNIRIDNAGVNYKTKNIRIKAFIFSEQAFLNDANNNGYTLPLDSDFYKLHNVLNGSGDKFCFYNKAFSRKSDKQGLGNISDMEGVNIVSNLAADASSDIEVGDFPGNDSFNTGTGDTDTFAVTDNSQEIVEIIDNLQENPLYVAVWMRGNARRWWGTDKRKKRFQVYKINNLDLFLDGTAGKVTTLNWDGGAADNTKTGAGGGAGVEAAAFKITQFKMTINTLSGESNDNLSQALVDEWVGDVLPPLDFYPTDINKNLFLQISPFQQLNNSDDDGYDYSQFVFPEYFPFTTFGIIGSDGGMDSEYSDLQSYYPFQSRQSFRASAPATITFNIEYRDPENIEDLYSQDDFIHFVIDWDDKDDEIKTIDDFLNERPENMLDLQELQSQGLYTTDVSKMRHTYLKPGIKTIKLITISYDDSKNALGRWKLVTSRFFLDIPISEYPDFGEVGGDDYKTIPWPFTTVIIGGIDENSKYKTSIRNTLASGKIGSTDIIDEKFLTYADENDELGKSIENLDLEQLRYFNQSYNMNNLLKIEPMIVGEQQYEDDYISNVNLFHNPMADDSDFSDFYGEDYATSQEWLSSLQFPKYREELDQSDGGEGDGGFSIEDVIYWSGKNRPDISLLINHILNPSPTTEAAISEYIYPDYVNSWITTDDIPSAIIPMGINYFRPYNYTIDSPNDIEDPSFFNINHNNYNISEVWYGQKAGAVGGDVDRIGTDLYEQKKYDDDSQGIRIRHTATNVVEDEWTFFKYQRKDLNVNLKPKSQGGTHYIFKCEIKFNEYSVNAPRFYTFRPANRDNDYGTPFYNNGEYDNDYIRFYRGDDGVYSNSSLTNKIADYGQWIYIQKERRLISDYSSYRSGGELESVDGFPNMEFLTDNWFDAFDTFIQDANTDPEFLSTLPYPRYWEEFNISGGGFTQTDLEQWIGVGRPDIAVLIYYLASNSTEAEGLDYYEYMYPEYIQNFIANAVEHGFGYEFLSDDSLIIPLAEDFNDTPQSSLHFHNISGYPEAVVDLEIRNPIMMESSIFNQITDTSILNEDKFYWNGETNKFPEETSVGQIFINDNIDLDLKQSCKLEINTGELTDKQIYDSSGNSNSGLLIGDYKVKKNRKGQPMRRDSYIKVPKKTNNSNGAL